MSKNGIHGARLKAIRPYVSFNYNLNRNLTQYQKRKIKEYYEELETALKNPNQLYRPRKSENANAALRYAGMRNKEYKAIPVPNGGANAKISIRGGNLILKTDNVTSSFIPFDDLELIDDDNRESYVAGLIADRKEKAFSIAAGQHEIPGASSRNSLPQDVAILCARYDNPLANNHFGNWLRGVTAHSFTNQEKFKSYSQKKAGAKASGKRERKVNRNGAAKIRAKLRELRRLLKIAKGNKDKNTAKFLQKEIDKLTEALTKL